MFVAGNPFKSQRILPAFLPASLYFGVTIFRAAGSYYIPCVAASSPTHMMVRLKTIGKTHIFFGGDELIISWGCSCSGSGLVRISEPDAVWCAESWLVSQLPGGVPFHSHLESQRSPPLVWWLVVCRLMVKGANKGGFTIKIGVVIPTSEDKGGDYGWLVGVGHLRGDDVKQALQCNDVYDAFVWIDATMVWGIVFTIYRSKSLRVTRDLDVGFHLRQWACSNGYCTPVSNQLAKLALCWMIFPFLLSISPQFIKDCFLLIECAVGIDPSPSHPHPMLETLEPHSLVRSQSRVQRVGPPNDS